MKKTYFDHSATTPIDKKVLASMQPYFYNDFGNPSSLHGFGQKAIAAVDQSRAEIAKTLNCQDQEIIFTSGATEADNLAIFGFVKAMEERGEKNIHIITSAIEHPAVLEPCRSLEKRGVRVTYLTVNNKGLINLEKLRQAIDDQTALVSLMYVNSEIGSLQPIREAGKIIKKINEVRLKNWERRRPAERAEKPRKIFFHSDAVQAANFFTCDTKHLHLDLMSLSGHKIYGPKGIGVLFVKSGTPLSAIQLGGHHENNLRSGTLNVPGIVGLAKALSLSQKNKERNSEKISKIRDFFTENIKQKIPNLLINTPLASSSPSHANITFIGAEGESILIALDLLGVAVSTGSACASGDLKASPVLLAMGIKEELAHGTIRFTFGKYTSLKEIEYLFKILPPIIKKLRKISPLH